MNFYIYIINGSADTVWNQHIILSRDWVTTEGVWIGNRIYWTLRQLVTEINYESLAELHIQTSIVATAHIKFSQSLPAVTW
jgi:hypothetical protein